MLRLFTYYLPFFFVVLNSVWSFQSVSVFAQENPSKAETVRILFAGDIMLDGGPGHVVASGRDPFARCETLFKDIDLSVGNLECVLGKGGKQELKAYTFRGASDSPRFLKKYFDVVSLANNHTMDFGVDGIVEMLNVLEREKLPYFGAGRDIAKANEPYIAEIKGRRIAILGYNEFRKDNYAATEKAAGNAPISDELVTLGIEKARTEHRCDVVIPFLHWGEEMMPGPRPDQTHSARKWIDAGATAIVGSHPHVTQTAEFYRGAPIVYSLGNFVFDYFPVDPPEWIGWVAILKIDPNNTVDLEIRPVLLDAAGLPSPAPTE